MSGPDNNLSNYYDIHGRDRWHGAPIGYNPKMDLDDNMEDDPADHQIGNGALLDSAGDPLFEELYDSELEELYDLSAFEEPVQ